MFTIRHADGDRFVGQCAAIEAPFAVDHFLIGYQLDEGWWRQGLGTRAAEFLVHFGFGLLGADRLSADCLASNAGSIAILQRCGFTLEGRQRRQFFTRGKHHDQLLFGLLRQELSLDLAALAQRFG